MSGVRDRHLTSNPIINPLTYHTAIDIQLDTKLASYLGSLHLWSLRALIHSQSPCYAGDSRLDKMEDEIYKLEELALVNKVMQEIFNFTSNHDKTLAEFVIAVSVC